MSNARNYRSFYALLLRRTLLGVLIGFCSLAFCEGLAILDSGKAVTLFEPEQRAGLITAVVMSLVVGGVIGLVWGIIGWWSQETRREGVRDDEPPQQPG